VSSFVALFLMSKWKGKRRMWKRLMIALFMLLSAFSVGYAYYNIRLNAVQTAYLA